MEDKTMGALPTTKYRLENICKMTTSLEVKNDEGSMNKNFNMKCSLNGVLLNIIGKFHRGLL